MFPTTGRRYTASFDFAGLGGFLLDERREGDQLAEVQAAGGRLLQQLRREVREPRQVAEVEAKYLKSAHYEVKFKQSHDWPLAAAAVTKRGLRIQGILTDQVSRRQRVRDIPKMRRLDPAGGRFL